MTLGEAIRMYRMENGISQAQLAEKLQVSAMKVSRLENDQSIRITPELAKTINDLLSEERINSIDEKSKTLLKLKLSNNQSEQAFFSKKETGMAAQHCCEALQEIFSDYPIEIATLNLPRHGDFVVKFEGKNWVCSVLTSEDSMSLVRRDIAIGIGRAAMEPEISRYSLIWCTKSTADWEEIRPIQTFNNLNFDVTLLHFNLEKMRFDFEMDISNNFEGHGFFDIAVPEKTDTALKLYATWKTALSGRG